MKRKVRKKPESELEMEENPKKKLQPEKESEVTMSPVDEEKKPMETYSKTSSMNP